MNTSLTVFLMLPCAAGADFAAEASKNRPKQVEKQDALDGMIAKYRDTLFGSNKSKEKQTTSLLKRWFE
jgi:hypothetical protein